MFSNVLGVDNLFVVKAWRPFENHVFGDIDINSLCNQLGLLINFRQSGEDDNSRDLSTSEIITKLGYSSLSKMIPQVVDLTRLFVVSPASTATCERSFPQLRRVKTYSRPSMLQRRLKHLMILGTYKEEFDMIDIDDIGSNLYFVRNHDD